MPFGTIAASGWASGLNLYGTALLLGLAGRFGWADTPEQLQRPWVLAVLGVLYVLEFVVDKVPWLDTAWDGVHTVVRPLGGALLGGLLAHESGDPEVLAALLAGGFSLSAHAAKASTRAAVNTSPEPVSNVALSVAEDGIVAVMVALALAYPLVAGVVAVVLAITSLAVAWVLVRFVRRMRARWRERRTARRGGVLGG
ncbi:MAG: DUF4126 domain-containing protein [Acidimicrobiales bacterium]|nr:DUF4126 domain-containing protein [Acidimicrobiales bacterium]HRW38209.1 DUF4126 domain-containing protein [Aquihabitans sp.]